MRDVHLDDSRQGIPVERPVGVGEQVTRGMAVLVKVGPVQFAAHGQRQGRLPGRQVVPGQRDPLRSRAAAFPERPDTLL